MAPSKAAKGKAKADNVPPAPRTPRKKDAAPKLGRTAKKEQETQFNATPSQVNERRKNDRARKLKAKARNAPGVYLMDTDKVYVNDAAMAGYLGLGSSSKLMDFMQSNRTLLEGWYASKLQGFGEKKKTSGSVCVLSLAFETVAECNDEWSHQTSLPLDHSKIPDRRFYLSGLVAMNLLLQNNPHIGLGSQYPGRHKPIGGHDPEDWSRAYEFLRWFSRKRALSA